MILTKSAMRTFSRTYRNRICVPQSQDGFMPGLRHFLEENHIFYARVPIPKTEEIYYFFNSLEDTQRFLTELPRFQQ